MCYYILLYVRSNECLKLSKETNLQVNTGLFML